MDQEGSRKIINPAQQVAGIEEAVAVMSVLLSGHWAEGKEAEGFKKELGEFLGIKYVVLTNSGSSANLAAIMSLTTHWIPEQRRLQKGDEVITTALCFPTTVSPIVYAGCIPVFIDVDSTWNADVEQFKNALSSKTKAVIFAHNLGNPFNLDEIRRVCDERGIWLIGDNCDSLGSEWGDKRTGSIEDIATSSFYPAHHISTGEGGAIYTNNYQIYRAIKSMVNWGRDCWCEPYHDNTCGVRYEQQLGGLPKGYDHKNTYAELGFNLKMTDLQAVIGREQLKRIGGFMNARQENHAFLRGVFREFEEWFEIPTWYPKANPNWFGYVIKLRENAPFTRDEFVLWLDSQGIKSRAFFCGNITRQPVFWKRGGYRQVGDLHVSDDIMNNAFWIGVHPAIGSDERSYMQLQIVKFLRKFK